MSERPTGTITFLFTDIEGSTKLWERHPDEMKAALARHDTLLKDAIEARGGYVFKTVGDEFCAAFAEPTDALEAALAAQRSLQAEKWPGGMGAIRIRAALHTGVAEDRDGDYFGPPLNRVSRLLAAGHGGQTILTLATQELVRDSLPAGTSLADLGDHRLKDLFRPERVFQLNAPDLQPEFPPLRTLDARVTNLPAQPTPFIGRERELAALISLLNRPDVRLVTLSGAGGSGKTRLSLQAAADLIDDYEHGAYFVALDTIRDPAGVVPQIAGVLGVKPSKESSDLLADLKTHLHERQVLLLLDNFEQVAEAGPAISEIIAAAPLLKVMISSRAALNLYGEHDFPVPPLGLPDRHRKQTVAVLSQYESVALFIQRARAVKADFEINEANAPAIAEICYRLDGLPLAIELAAARIKMFPPPVLLERLSERLKTLTGGPRNLPARQQTLRSAIDWSYDLLEKDEKTLFARLGVFSGGWTLEAAEAVCGEGLARDAAALMESLLAKNLIRGMDSPADDLRFTMLETIHEYAVEKLTASPEANPIGGKHAEYVTVLMESSTAWTGADLRRAEIETGNVRRAVEWCLSHGQPLLAIRLGRVLYALWSVSPNWQEAVDWMSRVLPLAEGLAPEKQSDAHRILGALLFYRARYEEAKRHHEESLRLARESGDRSGVARSLNNLANMVVVTEGPSVKARKLYEEALAINVELGDKLGAGMQHGNLAELLIHRKEPEDARSHAADALRIFEELGNLIYQAWTWGNFAGVEMLAGDLPAARDAMRRMRTVGDEGDSMYFRIYQFFLGARLAALEGRHQKVARLLAAYKAHEQAEDMIPLQPPDQAEFDRIRAAACRKLGESAFQTAWQEGASLELEAARKLAEEAPPS